MSTPRAPIPTLLQQVQELTPPAADVEDVGRTFEQRHVVDQAAANLLARPSEQVLEADVGVGVDRVVDARGRRSNGSVQRGRVATTSRQMLQLSPYGKQPVLYLAHGGA